MEDNYSDEESSYEDDENRMTSARRTYLNYRAHEVDMLQTQVVPELTPPVSFRRNDDHQASALSRFASPYARNTFHEQSHVSLAEQFPYTRRGRQRTRPSYLNPRISSLHEDNRVHRESVPFNVPGVGESPNIHSSESIESNYTIQPEQIRSPSSNLHNGVPLQTVPINLPVIGDSQINQSTHSYESHNTNHHQDDTFHPSKNVRPPSPYVHNITDQQTIPSNLPVVGLGPTNHSTDSIGSHRSNHEEQHAPSDSRSPQSSVDSRESEQPVPPNLPVVGLSPTNDSNNRSFHREQHLSLHASDINARPPSFYEHSTTHQPSVPLNPIPSVLDSLLHPQSPLINALNYATESLISLLNYYLSHIPGQGQSIERENIFYFRAGHQDIQYVQQTHNFDRQPPNRISFDNLDQQPPVLVMGIHDPVPSQFNRQWYERSAPLEVRRSYSRNHRVTPYPSPYTNNSTYVESDSDTEDDGSDNDDSEQEEIEDNMITSDFYRTVSSASRPISSDTYRENLSPATSIDPILYSPISDYDEEGSEVDVITVDTEPRQIIDEAPQDGSNSDTDPEIENRESPSVVGDNTDSPLSTSTEPPRPLSPPPTSSRRRRHSAPADVSEETIISYFHEVIMRIQGRRIYVLQPTVRLRLSTNHPTDPGALVPLPGLNISTVIEYYIQANESNEGVPYHIRILRLQDFFRRLEESDNLDMLLQEMFLSVEADQPLPANGLEDEEIEALGVVCPSEVQTPNPDNCCICLGAVMEGDIIRRLPCSHEMHKDCIDQWFRTSSRCPLCRVDFKQ